MNNKLKEHIKENLDIAIDGGTTLIGGVLSDALVGQIVPGIATTYLSYKQKRTEKMLTMAIEELRSHINDIEKYLEECSNDYKKFISNNIVPLIFDKLSIETQEDKVIFIINGFRTIINNTISEEDIIIAYYDILSNLRTIEINILLNLYKESKKMIRAYEIDKTIRSMNKYEAIETHLLKKLENLGLVSIRKYPEDLQSSFNKITPDKVDISILGINFIEFFCIE